MTTKLPAAFSPEVLAALSAKARREMERPYSPVDPRFAELGGKPRWYVVEIKSRQVEKELAKRRFGIYVPETIETVVRRGRKYDQATPMIGGYVFVFLWETDENFQRLLRVWGVTLVVGWIDDREIDRLRYLESCERLDAVAREELKEEILRKVKRSKPKKSRKLRAAFRGGKPLPAS
ncbi:transcription termination/antitermination protein NusG [Bradyrhizobium sp. DOA9]|uniref:transcription termination/antitermination protein NusG n=1 Tax=Bradyrhizobium sp. DOA9 TaxID=1126627 RepID=UPI000468A686|nr:transcription termination/antitermination NusG family protein [Bradyrhizobium sp. DOA9]GAJ35153.1 hypothetical protein BDOA9_0143520 [Bradyrhizobium sp. DOA9]